MAESAPEALEEMLRLSNLIRELAGRDDPAELERLATLIEQRHALVRSYFETSVVPEVQQDTAMAIRAILELDAESTRLIHDRQQRLAQELALMRKSRMASEAYTSTEDE